MFNPQKLKIFFFLKFSYLNTRVLKKLDFLHRTNEYFFTRLTKRLFIPLFKKKPVKKLKLTIGIIRFSLISQLVILKKKKRFFKIILRHPHQKDTPLLTQNIFEEKPSPFTRFLRHMFPQKPSGWRPKRFRGFQRFNIKRRPMLFWPMRANKYKKNIPRHKVLWVGTSVKYSIPRYAQITLTFNFFSRRSYNWLYVN